MPIDDSDGGRWLAGRCVQIWYGTPFDFEHLIDQAVKSFQVDVTKAHEAVLSAQNRARAAAGLPLLAPMGGNASPGPAAMAAVEIGRQLQAEEVDEQSGQSEGDAIELATRTGGGPSSASVQASTSTSAETPGDQPPAPPYNRRGTKKT